MAAFIPCRRLIGTQHFRVVTGGPWGGRRAAPRPGGNRLTHGRRKEPRATSSSRRPRVTGETSRRVTGHRGEPRAPIASFPADPTTPDEELRLTK